MRQLLLEKYFVQIILALSIFILLGCEKKFDTVINSAGSAPLVSNATLLYNSINTDTMYNANGLQSTDDILTIRETAFLKATHLQGVQEIANVKFSLLDNQSASLMSEGYLKNNGIFPDANAFDSVYSGFIDFQINRVFVGNLTVALWSEDKLGSVSNTALLPIRIIRTGNHKPVLSNLQMDTLVSIGEGNQILYVRITASDPDGLADITDVFFNSFKPDGNPSSGNPFKMYDDGKTQSVSGDAIAGDGIFSLGVQLPNTAQIGTYRFEFHATDRSNATSNTIIRYLVVTI